MSQGIVRVKPKPNSMGSMSPGSLTVSVADRNTYGVKVGDTLEFPDPGFSMTDSASVIFTINSAASCTVTGFAPVPPKHHSREVPVPPGEDAQ